MEIGTLLLNWGVLLIGLILFGIGCLYMLFYARAYKMHVLRYGRLRFGKQYGTDWTKADARGVFFMQSIWTVAALVVSGVLLFLFTGLAEIGIPLWLGCTLGIAGIFLFFVANMANMSLAKREAEIAWRHKLEDEE